MKSIKKIKGIEVHGLHEFDEHHPFPEDTSFLFSVGGDGTFLESARIVRDRGIPVVGINTGRLGFLAGISSQEITESVDMLLSGQYSIEERTLLHLTTSEGEIDNFGMALNEVTIHKSDLSMITIQAELDGEFLNAYWADGLIISTPTGSTAYSMSVGGPIMLPESESFIIAPVSPHNLTVRPIVIPDTKVINLVVLSRNNTFNVALDSRNYHLNSGTVLTLRKADYKLKLVKFPEKNFYNTLRNKLMWGMDRRN
jgi:NAD+ kinase